LNWSPEVLETAWQTTCGHPFLTQQLCATIWEQTHDTLIDNLIPTVTPHTVHASISRTLEASQNTLNWLWDGLGPAERVVASALAEAKVYPVSQEQLESTLQESGVRIVIRELQNAPYILEDWDLIKSSEKGYTFQVELLRRWITEHKPLTLVQGELDHIEPVADNLYRAAMGLYQAGELQPAISPLRQAIGLNPNHVGANQLLADILLAQGQASEAQRCLERLYKYRPVAARPRLIQALLTQAHATENDDVRLALYGRVLELSPTQPEAKSESRLIWERWGKAALESDSLEAALEAFQMANLPDQALKVEREIMRRQLIDKKNQLRILEQDGQYTDALELVQQLVAQYPEEKNWNTEIKRLERAAQLAMLYQRGLGAIQSGDRQKAQNLLAQVVLIDPQYEEATRYLHIAVTSTDPKHLQWQLDAQRKAYEKLLNQLATWKKQHPLRYLLIALAERLKRKSSI
jgi:tetratricopeptide (TPR) repeat protein